MLTREAAFVAFQLLLFDLERAAKKRVCHAFAACTFNKASVSMRLPTVTNQPIPIDQLNADTTSGRYHRVFLAFRVRRVG